MTLSDKNKENLLQTGLFAKYHIGETSPIPKQLTIVEVFDETLIYDVDGQLYEATYKIVDGVEEFGDPKQVTATKMYRTKACSLCF